MAMDIANRLQLNTYTSIRFIKLKFKNGCKMFRQVITISSISHV